MPENMPPGLSLSMDLPNWLRLAIADAVVVFGRMEQEIVEITWVLQGADMPKRLKLARVPATENFVKTIESIEVVSGEALTGLKVTFEKLTYERNLIVHGAWNMFGGKPWVV